MRLEIKELRKAAERQALEKDKMLNKFKDAMGEKAHHDTEYHAMKEKFDDMRKQMNEKDKYIVDLGKSAEKQHKTVDEVKGNLEKTYLTKIKCRPAITSSAEPASRERLGGEGFEPNDRVGQ